MLKKIVGLFIVTFVSFVSFSFAVTEHPGTFGDATRSSNVNVPGTGTAQGEGFISAVKNFINWVLGLLALIALIYLLWGGFQMVTAGGDDKKYQAGFTILKQAGIGLVFIGVSWLVVSLIFSVVGSITS